MPPLTINIVLSGPGNQQPGNPTPGGPIPTPQGSPAGPNNLFQVVNAFFQVSNATIQATNINIQGPQNSQQAPQQTPPPQNNNTQQTIQRPSFIDQAQWAGTQVAQNKGGEILLAGIDKAADGIGALGEEGQAVAAVMRSFTGSIRAADAVVEVFTSKAQSLAYISPQIATANAVNQVKTIQADIRENAYLGESLAKLVEAETDLDIAVRESLYPIKKFIVEELTEFIEFLKGIIQGGQEFFFKVESSIGEVGNIIKELVQGKLGNVETILKTFMERQDEQWKKHLALMQKKDEDDIVENFFKVLGSGPGNGPVAPLPIPGGGLGLPINR
jgi:hypothetical protein